MVADELIGKIEAVICDVSVPREARVRQLKKLADECWNSVFPERGSEAYENLGSEEESRRWKEFWERVKPRVERSHRRKEIMYVLDWPASGGTFEWVK